MERYARITNPSKGILVEKVDRPYSLFDFVEGKFAGLDTLRRTMIQARCHGVKTMVMETLENSLELQEENADIKTAIGQSFKSTAYRLSFFNKRIITSRDIEHAEDKDFIGYAIIKEDFVAKKRGRFHLYESVIKKSPHSHNFIRGEQDFECKINGVPFNVKGYLYCQQNGITNVCAHAVLRTIAARFLPKNDLSYREINDILKIDHKTKKVGWQSQENGLSSTDMLEVLEEKGINCFPTHFAKDQKTPPVPYQQFIYGHIESGYPAIVFFRTMTLDGVCHVISVFGHTFNQDIWVPSADRYYFRIPRIVGSHFEKETKYTSSDCWLSMYVGHDDNVGSNLCIPQHYLQTKWWPDDGKGNKRIKSPMSPEVSSVAYVISTLPVDALLSPIMAEVTGARYLTKYLMDVPNLGTNRWSGRFHRLAQSGQLVLRPLIIDGERYISHLKRLSDWHPKPILQDVYPQIQKLVANHLLWMVEISVPELFSATKRKIGEILLRADVKAEPKGDIVADKGVFVLARLPGLFIHLRQGVTTRSTNLVEYLNSGIDEHTEVYGCEEKAA